MAIINGIDESRFFSKKRLVKIGQDCWGVLYKCAANDDEVLERAAWLIAQLVNIDPIQGPPTAAALLSPDQITAALAAGRWIDQGLPVFRFGHKRVAALMATHTPVELADRVKPPFKSFFIEIPPGLLSMEDSEGELREVKGVIVHQAYYTKALYGVSRINQPIWSWMAVTEGPVVLWQANRTTEELCSIDISRDPVADHERLVGAFNLDLTDSDHRVNDLINRLICATCLLVTGHNDEISERKEIQRVSGKKARVKNSPEFRVFTMGSPVSVDVRPALKEYLSGHKSTTPSVQFLVRGHWRHQAYGEQRLLRKLLWIEPFWKGPDGSLITSKTYTLKGKHNESEEGDVSEPA
jgi:hypothetical protein